MKRTVLFIYSLLFAANIMAQQPVRRVAVPPHTYSITMCPDLKHAMVVTENVFGHVEDIAVIDATDSRELWRIKITGERMDVFSTPYGILFCENGNTKKPLTTLFDTHTGRKLYSIPYSLNFRLNSSDIMFGYKKPKDKQIEARRMSTGTTLWTTKMQLSKSQKNDIFPLADDNHLMVIGKDLYAVNMATGHVIAQPIKTDIQHFSTADKVLTATSVFAGIVSAAFLGSGGAVISQGTDLHGIHSNILSLNDHIYVSDRNHIYCYTPDLTPVWQHDFEATDKASVATLCAKDDTLILTNQGIGYYNDQAVNLGRKKVITFDANTGNELGRIELPKKWNDERYGDEPAIYSYQPFMVSHGEDKIIPVSCPALSVAAIDTAYNVVILDQDLKSSAVIPSERAAFMSEYDGSYYLFFTPDHKLYVADADLNVILSIDDDYLDASIVEGHLVVRVPKYIDIYKLGD